MLSRTAESLTLVKTQSRTEARLNGSFRAFRLIHTLDQDCRELIQTGIRTLSVEPFLSALAAPAMSLALKYARSHFGLRHSRSTDTLPCLAPRLAMNS